MNISEIDEAMRFLTERSILIEGLADRAMAKKMVDNWLEQVKAESWDEGHDAGWAERHEDALIAWVPSGPHESDAHNPYRKEQDA